MQELHSIQTVSVLKEMFVCLFGHGSLCEYNPADPVIYLSIGDALAATGLIFAAYQLADKGWKLRHKIRSRYSMSVIWLGCLLGIVFALFASLLPQFAIQNRQSFFLYPIVWEALSLCFFTIGVAYFVVIGLFQRGFFNSRLAKNFYRITVLQISHTEPEIMIDIINNNLSRIMKVANEKNESGEYANAILECIVSTDHTMEYIATKRIDFIFNFFTLVKDQETVSEGTRNALNGIIKGLFQFDRSFLYSQYKHEGLSRFASVYELIFSDPKIFKEIDLLMCWEAYEYPMRPDSRQLSDKYLGAYLHAMSLATKAYFMKTILVPII